MEKQELKRFKDLEDENIILKTNALPKSVLIIKCKDILSKK
jgi:hypothetical protein